MTKEVRDVFIFAALIALYGAALWLAQRERFRAWADTFASDPKATFAHEHDRERMIAEEFAVAPSEVSNASD
jgi:hypothetical protein